ncbi:MAG: portal protein [Alphaproteobacteria bacterium]|nr:portal protein [Alphaproteobacteria bacterium]
MIEQHIQETLRDFGKLEGGRRVWDSHFQDLADVLWPGLASITRQSTPGEKRTGNIYDGTPMLAVRGLVSAIDGMLKPKTSRWMSIRAADDEINEDDGAKSWLEQATDIMFREFYRPRARFIQASGETDRSLVVLGSGTVFVTESRDMNGLLFRSLPLRDTFYVENADGVIDTLYWRTTWPAYKAEQVWGREKLGPEPRRALEEKRGDAEFKFLQIIRPRDQREPGRRDAAHMPWQYLAIDVASAHVMEESGFEEWPFATPRWDTESGETYGRSPGMLSLPDSRTLQQQGKTILKAGHMAVEPPLMAPHESIVRGPSLVPGGITYYNAAALRAAGLRDPIRPLFTGAQIPLAREMQRDVREQIFAGFFRNVLNLPVNGPAMTATEIIERKEEFVRTIGPVFGRLEADYMAPMVERAFGILLRQGKFPPPPESLQGQEVRFEFASPVEKVRRQIDTMNAVRTIEMIAPFVQADPAIMDNFNGDEIARDAAEFNSMPQSWLNPRDQVAAKREQAAAGPAGGPDLMALMGGDGGPPGATDPGSVSDETLAGPLSAMAGPLSEAVGP